MGLFDKDPKDKKGLFGGFMDFCMFMDLLDDEEDDDEKERHIYDDDDEEDDW